jgi:hypothetical protein
MRQVFAGAVLVFGIQTITVAAQDRFFDSNGVQIRYVEQGSGEPVVLVHGRNESLETWITTGVFSKLAADLSSDRDGLPGAR